MRKPAFWGLMLFSTIIFADGDALSSWKERVYLGVEGGFSISTAMNFQPDYSERTHAAWGVLEYGVFNSDMNTSEVVGGLIGYKVNPNIAIELNYDYRGNFEWQRDAPLPYTQPLTNIGETYTAHDIQIQTLFVGVNLNPAQHWNHVTPYVSIGVGAAWNTIGSLENSDVASPFRGITQTYDLVLGGQTTTNFAWRAGIGVDYQCPWQKQLHINLNYRFTDVGTLQTGINLRRNDGSTDTINPFRASHVQLNDIILGLNYHFA